MHIAVFGAAGWLGRALLANLKEKHTVRAVDRSPESWQAWEDVDGTWEGETLHGEITDFAAVDARPRRAWDAAVHATAFFPGNRPAERRGRDRFRRQRPRPVELPRSGAPPRPQAGRPHRLLPQPAPGRPFLHRGRPPARRHPVRGDQAAAGGDVPPVPRGPRAPHRRHAPRLHRRQPHRPGPFPRAAGVVSPRKQRLGLPARSGGCLQARPRVGEHPVRHLSHGGGNPRRTPPARSPAPARSWG